MNTLPKTTYLRQNAMTYGNKPQGHTVRVMQDLQNHGVTRLGLRRMSSRFLPRMIHADEPIGGVVYGRGDEGSVMLVATDRRVIFLDRKPLFVSEDEVTYDVVSGVSYGHGLFASTLTLHTRIRDYTVHTFNQGCAEEFVRYIESRCLEHRSGGQA